MVTLAGYRFAVEVRYAREVVVFDEYTIVPLAPPHLLGVANLRGNIMPVVDIRPLLGMARAGAGQEVRALVVERDRVKVALLIDEVLGLEPLDGRAPADDRDGPGPGAVIVARLEREDGEVALLDVRALLTAMGGDRGAPGKALT
ncbi:MAG TPA: chemotaxis protein CheW [Candidatus Acidoferrales bacterium]|nr:chemotaxis protein CheW [Candidatus Acidoferrales bacterium]